MKNMIIILMFVLMASFAIAQDGYTHFQFRTGYIHKEAVTLSLGFDFAKKYYAAWELTGTYQKSFNSEGESTYTSGQINHDYENLLLGVQYKPLLIRSKNTAIKFRFGGFVGTDFNNFIASPNIGFEILQSISRSVDLTFTNNNGYFFWAEKPTRWRNSMEVGLRVAM